MLNHLVNHKNTQLNPESGNQASNRHILSFEPSLQSHPLWVTLHHTDFKEAKAS